VATKQQKAFRRWIAEMPCEGCGIEDDTRVAHHLTFCGTMMGGKVDDMYQVCLCYICHIEKLHRHGEKTFWATLGRDLDELKAYAASLYNWYYRS